MDETPEQTAESEAWSLMVETGLHDASQYPKLRGRWVELLVATCESLVDVQAAIYEEDQRVAGSSRIREEMAK